MTLYDYSIIITVGCICLCVGVFIGLVRGITWERKKHER